MKEQIMVFSKEWFKKHNKTLCWFANAPIIKYWFRWLLRIHNDIDWNEKIEEITPNSFTYGKKLLLTDKGLRWQQTTDFRTHEKFGKRLYYGLKPFWYLLHFWDWGTSIQPALNCGFDTLTVYPDAGTGNTTVDGGVRMFISGGTSSFDSLVNGAGYSANPTATIDYIVLCQSHSTTNWWVSIGRGIFLFDTSSLTSESNISLAILSIYGREKYNELNASPSIDIYLSNPASNNNLVASDYSTLGSISQTGDPITYDNYDGAGYNAFTFNTTGISNISKTGISKFGTREVNYDVANSAPTWYSNKSYLFGAWLSDETGTTYDPKLVVTYTLPSAFIPRITWFN